MSNETITEEWKGRIKVTEEPDCDWDWDIDDPDVVQQAKEEGVWVLVSWHWNGKQWSYSDSIGGIIGTDGEGCYLKDIIKTAKEDYKEFKKQQQTLIFSALFLESYLHTKGHEHSPEDTSKLLETIDRLRRMESENTGREEN